MRDHEKAQLESCVRNARFLCMELETMVSMQGSPIDKNFKFDELLRKAQYIRNELLDAQRDNS